MDKVNLLIKKRGTWHLPVPLLEVLVYLISRSQKQSAWRRSHINRDKCRAKLYWLRSPSELGNLQMSVQNWEIKMKLPNFSATFYRLTTFLLGLKGVHSSSESSGTGSSTLKSAPTYLSLWPCIHHHPTNHPQKESGGTMWWTSWDLIKRQSCNGWIPIAAFAI